MKLLNQRVIVLGAGRSGRAAAALALREGASVEVHDTSERIDGLPEGVQAVPNASETTAATAACDLLVISPGIDGESAFAQAYARQAGEMIGEIELAYRFYDGRIVAITGTNGKTTTTELVQRILDQAGLSCVACGNYGVPFAEVVLQEHVPAAVALEVSSFQLETIDRFHPDVVIWLNFSADHMDRYPDLASYKKAKLRVFENLDAQNHIVVRAGEEIGEQTATQHSFSTENAADYRLEDGWICHHGHPVLDLSVTRLRGLHNAENAMAAFAACSCLGVNVGDATESLRGFAPPLHRCELIRTLDGVEYINDSKATNLHALDSALRSQLRPIVLIAGGKQKGLDYSSLIPRLKETTKAIVVFGEIAECLAETFAPVNEQVPVCIASSLEDAVERSAALSGYGDTVLFSPGTSSFDMFNGYEERGDAFRSIVASMK
ncbi:UDP-N-acetylmuramoyl-L-alanine--D-glutamate ligase [Verrucomicrobiaceae bacterium N1E253]|uniref:UDP-N-acetylmuramoylalanine--D-glutamate ligase n=1 Tax=Oceaniferula marina TaxID=2748318 RepID=A0A851GKB1_9BACT|nr:UDP-N-acetylmuramoyl-L-alanine--D-glutamate ligase [Oceaniferula marina]NWK56291.1 UDP-N-acetylmuramoyl-L-alanine--D-glutamate ligase [Oceaniferula marina]